MTDTTEKKLTIAMVNDAVTDCIAGSFISTRRFAKILKERGNRVLFIAAKSSTHPSNDTDEQGIRAFRFRSFLMPKSEGQVYLGFPSAKELQKIFTEEKVDVVHIMIPFFSALSAMKAAKALNIPVVVHSHTQPENIFMNLPGFLPKGFLNRQFCRYLEWFYGRADAIVFPSVFSQQQFPNLKHMEQAVISNGVDGSVFHSIAADSFLNTFSLDREKKYVLYLGRLHPEKSVDTFIKAIPLVLQSAPDTHFLVAGFGHLEGELKALAEKLGVTKHVTFCGKLSDEEVVLAFNAASLYVLPSLAELEGMTVLEAMACGCPVLIADSRDSAARYMIDGNGFLFAPKDSRDLAEKITRLMLDEPQRAKFSATSLSESRRYDIQESVTKLEGVYRALVPTP